MLLSTNFRVISSNRAKKAKKSPKILTKFQSVTETISFILIVGSFGSLKIMLSGVGVYVDKF